ncbi:uncharacterized protein LOC120330443 [Styela clava]|uniref:uncharacterized protein LOC120330443 n=1 Tax=Styela clava TaxID=7725 RepID=UPI00193A21B5|nr:uncharacterized protein LOC120330443 [Styela clava]
MSSEGSSTNFIRLYEDQELAYIYAIYRPPYPDALREAIMNYLEKNQHARRKKGKFDKMLDVGCGSGTLSTQTFTSHFKSILGIDISEAKIKEAKRLNKCRNVAFELVDSYKFPVEDNSVDLITCATSIHFLDLQLLEKECERVLKPRGCCAVYTINWGNITKFSVGGTDWRHKIVLLNPIVADFFVNVKSYSNNFAALERNRQFYEQIINSSKLWLQEIVCEREMTLRQLKNVFRTAGEYAIFMKHDKPTTDPLEIFDLNIRQALELGNVFLSEDIFLKVEMVYPIFVFTKHITS